ncbi:MAG: hypothetical protein F9K24_22365 [Leptonema illini]|uniref:Uncharacterized protein n=1 Tax=Leptonema illini TaxID=183 RepID=A0A833LV26_9LEPT|nr:MAG: hypothetical protein F9K24_22365 [Leptonema illini]
MAAKQQPIETVCSDSNRQPVIAGAVIRETSNSSLFPMKPGFIDNFSPAVKNSGFFFWTLIVLLLHTERTHSTVLIREAAAASSLRRARSSFGNRHDTAWKTAVT